MRIKVVRTLVLALMLCGAGMIAAQQPGGKDSKAESGGFASGVAPKQKSPPSAEKSKLEEMLAEALKNNPDIRVAAANVSLAEAELNRVRLQVTQKVVQLHQAIRLQKAAVDDAQKNYDRTKNLQSGTVSQSVIDAAAGILREAKAKQEELEARLPALLGKTPQAGFTQYLQEAKPLYQEEVRRLEIQMRRVIEEEVEWKKSHKATGPMADKIRKTLLNRSITVNFKDKPIKEVVDALAGDSGLVIQYVEYPVGPLELTVTLRCVDLPLGAALQLLEDSLPGHTILVRDYGLLITQKAGVPPGAISVQEFLRQKPAEK